MKNIIAFILLSLSLTVMSCQEENDEITIETLLSEMVDRDHITYFPEKNYQSLQASSYNRESVSPDKPGWFADSDGVYCIREEENNGQKEWVLMEDEGPGVITKIWAVCFYYGLKDTTGANINIYLDGKKKPTISTNFFSLVKGQDFIKSPFAEKTTRAGNLYFPIPYAKSCKITMDKKVFYNIINYRKYHKNTKVKTFSMEDYKELGELIERVGEELLTHEKPEGKIISKTGIISKNDELTIPLPPGEGAIRQLEIKLKNAENIPQALRSTILTAQFDGTNTLWCPIGDFFNNVGKQQSYEMWERSVSKDGTMVCRWVMPYKEAARIRLINLWDMPVEMEVSITIGDYQWKSNSMHFYASWRMDPPTPTFPLFDWNFLEAEGKGLIVGDEWAVLNPRQGWWGEGDEKIYIDDDIDRNFPSHFGTGTEDYYGWAGGVVPTPEDEFSKPFLGNIIVGDPRSKGYNVCTRTRSLDAIPFNRHIRFDFESSCGTRQRWHYLQYAQTTFWYGMEGVTHNRPPLPEMAAQRLPSVKDLEETIAAAKGELYVVEGAKEAELLQWKSNDDQVETEHAEIEVWGEKSNGQLKEFWFVEPGDYVEVSLTEQFEKSNIQVAAAVGKNCGVFDVYVNDELKITQDLYSNHSGITNPLIDLENSAPKDNAFTIRFVYKKNNDQATAVKEKFALGIDYILVNNKFLDR